MTPTLNTKITNLPKAVKLIVVCTIGLLFHNCSFAQSPQSREYNIKAVFLYNFTQFINWPPQAFSHSTAPFVIGILGSDPFGNLIDATVSGERVKGHPIVVQRFADVSEVKNCHILFFGGTETASTKELLAALPRKAVLTVSDLPDFTRDGGIIRFVTRENKIKLQINLAAAKGAALDISSKLLRVSEIVETQR